MDIVEADGRQYNLQHYVVITHSLAHLILIIILIFPFSTSTRKLNNQRRHLKVVSIFDVLLEQRKLVQQKGILAAMNSFGVLRLPLKAKSLATLPALEGATMQQSQYVATLLLDAYRAADRLDMLQDLLASWLELHETNHAITELKKKIITMKSGNSVGSTVETVARTDVDNASADPLKGLSKSDLSANLPSIIAWNIILSAYAERGAWIQCVSIIEFINNNKNCVGKVNFEDLRTHSNRYSYVNNDSNDAETASLAVGRNDDIWFIYYNTIRCLVYSRQYNMALKYINQMKHQAKLEPSVPILSLFLKMVKSPIFDRPIDASTEKSGGNDLLTHPLTHSLTHSQTHKLTHSLTHVDNNETILKSLLADIREVLLVLVNDVSKNEKSNYDNATRLLLSSYVSFLCSRGLVHEGEVLLDTIYSTNEGGPRCIAAPTVEFVMKKLAYESEGIKAVKWFDRLAHISDGRHYYTRTSLAYHHVCDALRRSKDFDRLVSFIEDPFATASGKTAGKDVQNNV